MIGKDVSPDIGKDTQFKPGQSGNPSGKPLGRKNLKTIVRDALALEAPAEYIKRLEERGYVLADNTWETILTTVAMSKAASGSVAHLRELWDRRDGKARQDIGVDADVKHHVVIGLPPVGTE